MSIKLMSLVWEMPIESSTAKLVLLALCDFANDKGESCFPSIRTLAEKSCLSERQTQRLVHDLIDKDIVSVVKNENGGKPGQTRNYKLNINKLKTGDNMTPLVIHTGDMDDGRRVTNTTETGDMGVTLTTKDPSIESSSTKTDNFGFSEIRQLEAWEITAAVSKSSKWPARISSYRKTGLWLEDQWGPKPSIKA